MAFTDPPAWLTPHVVFGGLMALLATAWAGVLMLDVWDLHGWGRWFTFEASPHMFDGRNTAFFYAWFDDRSPIEWMQWLSMGSMVVLAGWLSGRLQGTSFDSLRTFWLLMAAGGVLLLIEDAGSPRHRMIELLAVFPFLRPFEVLVVPIFELLIYFPALAAIPVYAFCTYYASFRPYRSIRVYLWVGFTFYAAAAVCSATSGLGWYHAIGYVVVELAAADHLLGGDIYRYPELGFWMMDTLFEESIELIGAAGLCAAAVAQYRLYADEPMANIN